MKRLSAQVNATAAAVDRHQTMKGMFNNVRMMTTRYDDQERHRYTECTESVKQPNLSIGLFNSTLLSSNMRTKRRKRDLPCCAYFSVQLHSIWGIHDATAASAASDLIVLPLLRKCIASVILFSSKRISPCKKWALAVLHPRAFDQWRDRLPKATIGHILQNI